MWISKKDYKRITDAIFSLQKEINALIEKMPEKDDVMITKTQYSLFGRSDREQYKLNDIVNLILKHLKLSIVQEEKAEITKLVDSPQFNTVTYPAGPACVTPLQGTETKKTTKQTKKKK